MRDISPKDTNPSNSTYYLSLFAENYASIAALEVRATSSGEPSLRLKFKNGTEEQEFRTLTMFGKTDVLLSEFVERLTVRACCFREDDAN